MSGGTHGCRRAGWLAVTGVLALSCAGQCPGQGSSAPAGVEVDGCRRNLHLIHDALGAYHRDTGEWPRRLSDLAESYVASEVLICPQCLRSRVFSVGNETLLNMADADPQTVYKWELNTLQKAEGVEGKTWLDWKNRQRLTAVGEAVPMVRCDQHEVAGEKVHLNLSFSGDVFVSRNSWEEEFRDVLATPYLMTPEQVFRDVRRISERVPARPTGAASRHLDLAAFANALPGDPWQDGTSGDTLAALLNAVGTDGLWEHGGVRFDVRALVQLDGRRLRPGEQGPGRGDWFYPTGPVTLPVHQAGQRLHLLGGAVFPAPVGAVVAELTLTYAGGSNQRIPWRYGTDLRDGWHDTETGEEHGHLAWTSAEYTAKVRGVPDRSGPLKVYHWSVDLEKPGEEIASITFSSSASHPDPEKQYVSGPFLLAATLE